MIDFFKSENEVFEMIEFLRVKKKNKLRISFAPVCILTFCVLKIKALKKTNWFYSF